MTGVTTLNTKCKQKIVSQCNAEKRNIFKGYSWCHYQVLCSEPFNKNVCFSLHKNKGNNAFLQMNLLKISEHVVMCAYYYYLKKGRKCAIKWEAKPVAGHKARISPLTSNCITS